jgi:hypothetical protein
MKMSILLFVIPLSVASKKKVQKISKGRERDQISFNDQSKKNKLFFPCPRKGEM